RRRACRRGGGREPDPYRTEQDSGREENGQGGRGGAVNATRTGPGPASGPPGPPGPHGGAAGRPAVTRLAGAVGGQNLSLLAALGLLVAVIGLQRPSFFRPANLITIGVTASLLGLVSLAQTVTILSGGLDISIGAVVGLASVFAATGAASGMLAGIGYGVLAGTAAGLLNGLLIRFGRVNPVIATLATFSAFQGATFIAANGGAIGVSDR